MKEFQRWLDTECKCITDHEYALFGPRIPENGQLYKIFSGKLSERLRKLYVIKERERRFLLISSVSSARLSDEERITLLVEKKRFRWLASLFLQSLEAEFPHARAPLVVIGRFRVATPIRPTSADREIQDYSCLSREYPKLFLPQRDIEPDSGISPHDLN